MAKNAKRHNNHRHEALWQDIEHEEMSRTEFERLANHLERYTVAGPSEQQTKALLTTLTSIIEPSEQSESVAAYDSATDDIRQPIDAMSRSIWSRFARLLLQQVPLFSWIFWVTSVVIIILGAIAVPFNIVDDINPFYMIVPLVSGFGVYYALRSYRTPMGELEATFPVSSAEMMVGRLGVVLLYNTGFALLASGALFIIGATDTLILFIISWLVPLCFYTVFTLICMLKLSPLPGAIVAIIAWGAQLFLRELLGPFYLLSEIDSPYWELSRWLGTVLTLLLLAYVIRVVMRQNKGRFSDADSA